MHARCLRQCSNLGAVKSDRLTIAFVVNGNETPQRGGSFVFQQRVVDGLKEHKSKHRIIFVDHTTGARISDPPAAQAFATHRSASRRSSASQLLRRIITRSRRNATDVNDAIASPLQCALANPDIDLAWFLTPSAQVAPCPFVVTVWDLQHRLQPWFPEVSNQGATWEQRDGHYCRLLPRATKVITGTATGKAEIARFYGVDTNNIHVLPMPAPSVPLGSAQSGNEIREKFGLPDHFIFYPAQFWPHKNHVTLLRSLAVLKREQRRVPDLVCVGSDKGNLEFVRQTAVDLGVSELVHFLGFVSDADMSGLYSSATALVFPSFFGPDNLPPLEAFAYGCPVAAADVPGARDQLRNAAYFFKPDSEHELATTVESICYVDSIRASLIREGFGIASSRSPRAYALGIESVADDFTRIRRTWSANFSLCGD